MVSCSLPFKPAKDRWEEIRPESARGQLRPSVTLCDFCPFQAAEISYKSMDLRPGYQDRSLKVSAACRCAWSRKVEAMRFPASTRSGFPGKGAILAVGYLPTFCLEVPQEKCILSNSRFLDFPSPLLLPSFLSSFLLFLPLSLSFSFSTSRCLLLASVSAGTTSAMDYKKDEEDGKVPATAIPLKNG